MTYIQEEGRHWAALLRVRSRWPRKAYHRSMEIVLQIEGDVVERQELLNGTQILTLEGAADAGGERWTLSGLLSWNRGLKDTIEGDITMARSDGAEVFATLARGSVAELTDGSGASHFSLEYEIDGGTGAFAEASGAIDADGFLDEAGFRGVWKLLVGRS